MLKITLIIFLLSFSVSTNADWIGGAVKLFKQFTQEDTYDKLTNSEIKHYMKSPDRCTVERGDDAMKSGIESYNKWQRAFNNSVKRKDRPKGAFSNAGKAFEFLYKSGCKDGWMHFRFAMVFYQKKDYKKSLKVLKAGTASIEKHYPDEFIAKYYKWFGDVARSAYMVKNKEGINKFSKKSFDQSIVYYKKSIEYGSANDPSFLLNFAKFLKKGNCIKASNAMIVSARNTGRMSNYANDKVIPKIKAIIPSIKYCEG